MLQQTQVRTVIPYWTRWMEALPTLQALAKAAPDRVLKLWEGLGYYSRARNLQKAARFIMERHGGVFPTDFEAILELPGVGRYTAGAVASIAFAQPRPIVDGNVARVLARYLGIKGDLKSKETISQLWETAEALVRAAESPSDFNQGLMELGATVCLPRNPLCEACPIQRKCFAFQKGMTASLPVVSKRLTPTRRVFRAVLLVENGRIFMRKRRSDAVNADFWELPNIEAGPEAPMKSLEALLGGTPECRGRVCVVKHTITRFRMVLEVFSVESRRGAPDGKWLNASELETFPVVNAHRKALEQLELLPPRKPSTGKDLME